jgi:hypothetical protein
MSLEAVLQDAPTLPARERLLAFAAHIDTSLAAFAASLRDGTAPELGNLREEERALAAQLDAATGDDTRGVAAAITEALDRMTDSIDTLAYLLRQSGEA